MASRKDTKSTRKPELVPRTPRGRISRVAVASKQEGQPGSIRINVPGGLRESSQQEAFLLGLPATHQNLAAVQGVLDKINARIHILRDLSVKDLSKEELKNYILELLGQPNLAKAKPVPGIALDTLLLEFMKHMRLTLRRSEGTLSMYQTLYNVVVELETTDLSHSSKILEELAKLEYPAYYRILQKLSFCCDWAVEGEKIRKNPFSSVLRLLNEPKPTDKHPDPFSLQAMERIIGTYRNHPRYHHYADLIEFYFLTGVRTGEAVALLWSDIDFEKCVIYIRKTISNVRGKPDPRDETKTKKNREFPIEDPALISLLQKLWSAGRKMSDFVFQEPDGNHIDRNRLYYSWYGKRAKKTLEDGTEKEYFAQGIVSKLAALGEENGGIDHYRPQYNTRHTFISLAIEGMIKLNESTMQDIATLADYVGNSADVILEHYLGRSGKRKIVIISQSRKGSEASKPNGEGFQAQTAQLQQAVELEQQNSQLKNVLQSLVQFTHTVMLQFVPEALRSQLSAFVATLVKDHLPTSSSNKLELDESLEEEIAKCAVWLSLENDANS